MIDAYTRPAGATAVDLLWNVSTWNPYAVVLMRTRIDAGPAPAPPCAKRRGAPLVRARRLTSGSLASYFANSH